ncbi:MAG: orotate phosphoribosyltransferase [Candidatus Dormibacteria bacterium]
MSIRDELHALLAERAFRWGDFVLSSGRRSNFYFDGRQVTLDGRGLHLVSMLMLERCRAARATTVGGLTLGADPIAAGVALQSDIDGAPLRAFIVRKEAKSHGAGGRIAGPALNAKDRVVIVDDTTTTGTSFLNAAEAAREVGASIVGCIVIVDREEGAAEALRAVGLPFSALFVRSEFAAPS